MKKKVKFVFKKMIKETSNIHSFIFDVPKEFRWNPGQHGIWRFDKNYEMEGKKFRILSFASVEEENQMIISTRIVDEPSDFKKELLKLKKGDIMTVDGAMGKFSFTDYNRHTLMIAGGIGVTPMRGFIKGIDENNLTIKNVELIYSDDSGQFAYKSLFEDLNKKISNLKIDLISNRDEFSDKVEKFATLKGNNANYFISGSPNMVNFLSDKLITLGINKDLIKTDSFTGY